MQIHNKTTITKKDIAKSQQIWLLKSLPIVLVVAAAAVLLAFRIKDGAFVFESLPFAIIGGAIPPFYVVLVEILMAKQNKTLPPSTTFEYDFSENAISATATDGQKTEKVQVYYSAVKKYKIEKKYITIQIDKSSSFLIDRGGFSSPEELAKVEETLKTKIVKRKKFARKTLK